MRNTSLLTSDLSIPKWIADQFPLYVGITENDKDIELIRSCNDVFATSKVAQQQQVDKFSHQLTLAYGIAATLHTYINQDLDLIDYLENLEGMDERQQFFMQFLKLHTSFLEKENVNLYLNLLFHNANVPRQKIDDNFEFGALYTFSFLTKITEFWEKNKIYNNMNWTYLTYQDEEPKPTTPIVIYQLTKAYPPIVLINLNYEALAQKILEQHQQYILNLIIEMLLNTRQEYIEQHLHLQPYKYQSLEKFIEVLLKQCTTLQANRKNDLINNPLIKGYYERILKTDKAIAQIESELTAQIRVAEKEQQQQKSQQQQQQQQKDSDSYNVFKTQAFEVQQPKKRFITQHV